MGLSITDSVGQGGANSLVDVATIGGALVGVGVDNGGIFAPPLSLDGLGQAIAAFQGTQGLMAQPDGRVDPGGATLRRLNAILFPDEIGISTLDVGLPVSVDKNTWTPDEASLATEFVFGWTSAAGRGTIGYFQLSSAVVPRWFGVLVPEGISSFEDVHIFFHPTPAQAGHSDADYQALGSFKDIWHYLTDDMAAQFCAASTGRVLIMPLMTQQSSVDCGSFPQRWPEIAGCILGRLSVGLDEGAPFQRVRSVVVSSFSSGITYSHNFRQRANLGSRLAGVIDFDGTISSASGLSAAISGPTGRVVRAQQSAATPQSVPALAAQNIFPLQQPRWGGPWAGVFDPDPGTALLQIHGTIPQTMMLVAARRVE
jgi:hypothetical protein